MRTRWYVVQTKSHLEQFATDQLRNQQFEVFCPAYKQVSQRGKKTTTQILPLYPAYIFVKFDLEHDHWTAINNTRGVIGLLGVRHGFYVTPLPEGFVEEMLMKSSDDGLISLEESVEELIQFTPGMSLEVKDNQFKGLVGTYVQNTGDRVTLLLSLLSSKIKVSLPLRSVKTIPTQ